MEPVKTQPPKSVLVWVVDADTWAAFKANARSRGLTPSNAVAGLYAELLGAWSNSRHFIINNMVTRRLPMHPQIRQVLGNFASLYPLEIDLRAGKTFAGLPVFLCGARPQDVECLGANAAARGARLPP